MYAMPPWRAVVHDIRSMSLLALRIGESEESVRRLQKGKAAVVGIGQLAGPGLGDPVDRTPSPLSASNECELRSSALRSVIGGFALCSRHHNGMRYALCRSGYGAHLEGLPADTSSHSGT
jgi:hypothetical protein